MTPVLVVIPSISAFSPTGTDLGHPIAAMESLRDLGLLCWVDEDADAPPAPSHIVECLLFSRLGWFGRPPYPALRAGSWSVST